MLLLDVLAAGCVLGPPPADTATGIQVPSLKTMSPELALVCKVKWPK